MSQSKKRRVVVLGSGQAALTAACQMTDPKNPEAKNIDLTIYQFGWRLGGKGAAGRNMGKGRGYRIEEHGLHNWFGFYDNSFRQIQEVYKELDRSPDMPLAQWHEAFIAESEAIFVEQVGDRQAYWQINNPPNQEVPGSGGLLLPLWEYALMALEGLSNRHLELNIGKTYTPPLPDATLRLLERVRDLGVDNAASNSVHAIFRSAIALGGHALPTLHKSTKVSDKKAAVSESFIEKAANYLGRELEKGIEELVGLATGPIVQLFLDVLKAGMWALWEVVHTDLENDDTRRFWIMSNFVYGILVGSVKDGVFVHGMNVINEKNFRDWVGEHAYPDGELMLDSAIMRAVYDSSFAYVDGDSSDGPDGSFPPKAQYEAGTALHGLLRGVLTYKGNFGYKFAASTADTCYGPMYLVLKERGVKFEFFHRVLEVVPGASASDPIASIELYRQVDLTNPSEEYHPLFDVKGLPSWPSEPLWNQLKNGESIREKAVNFEHFSRDMDSRRKTTLSLGVDFDDVVLGISLAGLPSCCPGLFELSEDWRNMRDHVQTTRTMALQLWSRDTASNLGWPNMKRPMTSFTYDDANYLNVWGDLSDLIPAEAWASEPVDWSADNAQTLDKNYPQNIAYFTTAMADEAGVSPFDIYQDHKKAHLAVRKTAIHMLDKGLSTIWKNTNIGTIECPTFDWSVLIDASPNAPTGEDRIDSQFIRANISPTERYVLSVPGSSKYRLQSHNTSRFPNLYLTGDWTWCGINAGCMEAATMSGMLCSNALTSYPARSEITGVDF